jgi:hypothetical protein
MERMVVEHSRKTGGCRCGRIDRWYGEGKNIGRKNNNISKIRKKIYKINGVKKLRLIKHQEVLLAIYTVPDR